MLDPDDPRPFTYDEVLVTLREVVAEHPDFVYEAPVYSCVYAHGGQPSCGVGHVLSRLGLPGDALEMLDTAYPPGVSLPALDLRDHGIVDNRAARLLDEFQSKQDEEYPWGEALFAAEEAMGRADRAG